MHRRLGGKKQIVISNYSNGEILDSKRSNSGRQLMRSYASIKDACSIGIRLSNGTGLNS